LSLPVATISIARWEEVNPLDQLNGFFNGQAILGELDPQKLKVPLGR
jgi:hypothetical protein